MPSRNRLLLPVVMSLLAVGALVFAIVATDQSSKPTPTPAAPTVGEARAPSAPSSQGGFQGAKLPGNQPAPGFQLTDQYGRPVSLAAFRGQPVLLAFLYSRCGGACVVIAQQIRGALDELAQPVPVLLVSVDPSGDTPASVRRFLAKVSLSGRVHYLTGPPSRLAAIWRAYRVKPASAGSATFARFATVVLVDGRGRERVLYGQEQLTPDALVHDVGKLRGDAAHPLIP
jgi:protein SCO1